MSSWDKERIRELESERTSQERFENEEMWWATRAQREHLMYWLGKKCYGLPYIVPIDEKPEVLDKLFLKQVKSKTNETITQRGDLSSLWEHPNFQRTDEKREMLIKSPNPVALYVLVKDQETPSKLVNEVFEIALQSQKGWPTMEAIISHKNFQMEKSIIQKKMSEAKNISARIMVARDETVSKDILNKMLLQLESQRSDYQNKQDIGEISPLHWEMRKAELAYLEKSIKENPNFQQA